MKTILFKVKVPVLSEQMLFAPPIVSQAYILRTKFWSSNIFWTDKAKDIVTDNGNPSGIATTITVIPNMKKLRIFTISGPVFHLSYAASAVPFTIANRISKTTTIKIAEKIPNLPIFSAILSNFYWRGVIYSSSC